MTSPVPVVQADKPNVQIWALPRSGPAVYLRDLGDYTLSRERLGKGGSVTIEYPLDGLNFDVLAAVARPNVELEIEIRTDGSDSSSRHALLHSAKGDRSVPGATWSFTGSWLRILMEAAQTVYESSDEKGETKFFGSPGAAVRTLVQRAQARGVLTDITMSFSATHDSRGVPWPSNSTLSVAWSPGRDYLSILDELEDDLGVIEWDLSDARVLHLYVAGSRGTDRTLPPASSQIVLEWGRDIVDAPATGDNAAGATRVLGSGKDGLYDTATNPTAETARGRAIETFRSYNNVTDPATLAALVQAEASVIGDGRHEYSHELTLAEGGPRPGRDFDVADWILRAIDGATERLQVAQWTIKRSNGDVTGTVALGDLIDAHEVRTRRLIDRLQAGSVAVGTSTSEPEVDDGKPPAAPTDLVAVTDSYQVQGQTLAVVQLGWDDVVTNDDGTPATDVASYQVQWREKSTGDVYPWYAAGEPPGPFLSFGGLRPNLLVQLRVCARDKWNRNSEWSGIVEITTQADDEPPPKPAPLTADVDLGRVLLTNPETAFDGSPNPLDYSTWRLYSTLSATPAPATDQVVNEHQRGTRRSQYSPASAAEYGITRYFYCTALDRDGNESLPSDPVAATPTAIGYADIAYKNSGNVAEDGSFEDPSGRVATGERSHAAWSTVQAIAPDTAGHGDWFARVNAATAPGVERFLELTEKRPAAPGEQYHHRLVVRRSATSNGSLTYGVRFYKRDGTATVSPVTLSLTDVAAGVTWVEKQTGYHIAPVGTVSMDTFVSLAPAATAGTWDVDRVEVREALGTALIQDAAISNAKIANLDVGKLTSGELTAVIALLGEIRTANAPNARVVINDSGIRKYDANNVLRFEVTEGMTYLDGQLVTGRPGESRIAVGASYYGRDSLVAYDEANQAIVVIGQVYSQQTGQPISNGLLIQETGGRDIFQIYGSGVGQADLYFAGRSAYLNATTGQGVSRGGYLKCLFPDDGDTYFGRFLNNGTDSHHQINSSGTHVFNLPNARIAEINSNGLIATRFRGYGAGAQIEAQNGGDVVFYWSNGLQIGSNGAFVKSFVIDHPTDPDRWLVHGCTESPQAGVEYWGEVDVVDHRAEVELPAYFEQLTHVEGRQVQVSVVLPDEESSLPPQPGPPGPPIPGAPWPPPATPAVPEWGLIPQVAASRPRDGKFRISCSSSTARVAWLVKAVRKDVEQFNVEPLRSEVDAHGDGPYRYLTPRAA